ncbi:MAG: hypothetical protein JWM76_4360 [Pseudonocardiales bacterium]|nr:hypothetical protein [Pseudonocardiales bacterium]
MECAKLGVFSGRLPGVLTEAGASHSWRESVGAGVDGVVLVVASMSIEHGSNPLDGEPDTTVEVAVFVDDARIGRALFVPGAPASIGSG